MVFQTGSINFIALGSTEVDDPKGSQQGCENQNGQSTSSLLGNMHLPYEKSARHSKNIAVWMTDQKMLAFR